MQYHTQTTQTAIPVSISKLHDIEYHNIINHVKKRYRRTTSEKTNVVYTTNDHFQKKGCYKQLQQHSFICK